MDKLKKQSKIVSVRLPTDLITAVSLLSDKSKYLTMSNVIKLGVMSARICAVDLSIDWELVLLIVVVKRVLTNSFILSEQKNLKFFKKLFKFIIYIFIYVL